MSTKAGQLSIRQPVSVWSKPLNIEPKGFFLNLAKAVVNSTKLEFDDAFENLMDAVDNTTLENRAEQIAWVLLYRALMLSISRLVEDSQDLFELGEQPLSDEKMEQISQVLCNQLLKSEVVIDNTFFDRPEQCELLDNLGPGIREWLIALGMQGEEAGALVNRLPHYFLLSLHDEWVGKPEHYETIRNRISSPFTQATERARRWLRYSARLAEQVNTRMFSEAFGLQQVYVPLRAYTVEKTGNSDGSRLSDSGSKVVRRVCNIHTTLGNWVKRFNPDDTVRVVSGGPGSGKSSFAKMFAVEMSEWVKTIYIPLHFLETSDDLIDSVSKFAAQDIYLPDDPLDVKNGERELLVIFDGLDEISMQGRAALEVAQEFVEEVIRKSNSFASQGLKRQFLITGRDLAVQVNANRLRLAEQVLYVLPYYVDEKDLGSYKDPDEALKIDQRNLWWKNYGLATGKQYQEMPENLRVFNLAEITRQPLLNYLIALSQSGDQLTIDEETTLNQLYEHLFNAVYDRQWENGRRHSGTGDLSQDQFRRILEEVALCVWHGDGRTATIDTIHKRCENNNLARYLECFQEGAKKGVTRLLTAFYFRQAGDVQGEKTFEFTHKSFGEYLAAQRIKRALELIQTQMERRHNDPDDGWSQREALQHWAEICGPTVIDDYINNFLQVEIRSQPMEVVDNWLVTICQLIEYAVTNGMPMEQLGLKRFKEMSRQSKHSQVALLAIHASCALSSSKKSAIQWPTETSAGEWIKGLQGQRKNNQDTFVVKLLSKLDLRHCTLDGSDFFSANLRKTDLSASSLAFAILSYAELSEANLIGANLIGTNLIEANLIKANLSRANLITANLIGADLRRADLRRADLRGADLRRADLRRADLRRADLRGADLRRADLRRADLRRADLRGADLSGANLDEANLNEANLRGANLRGANLRGADLRGANLSEANLRGADLRGADLSGANLNEANLRGANLRGANLRGADLRGADLSGANLRGVNLTGVNLTGVNLDSANLEGAIR